MLAWGPAATWAAVLFLLSELRGVPRVPGLASNDKLVHFALYAVLGMLLAWGKRASPVRVPHWLAVAFGLTYGAVDELHQRFVPFRMPSAADWVADAVGVFTGYLLVLFVWALVAQRGFRLSERTR
jgi:VanZ family protein